VRVSARLRTRRAFLGVAGAVVGGSLLAGAVAWSQVERLLGSSGDADPDAPFARGPYLTRVDGTGADLRWVAAAERVVELVATAADGTAVTADAGRLQGLAPGTRYTWRAAVDGDAAAAGSFTTAPEALDGPFSFAVIGDYGDGGPHQRAVGRQIVEQDPRFVVTAGDNSYLVAASSLLDRNIFQPFEELLRRTPLVLCMGDHDEFWPGPEALLRAFDQERRQVVRYGPVQLVICGDRVTDEAGLAFVRDALAEPGPTVRFVVQHRPMQPGNPLAAVAREGGASAVFVGHLHRYERRVVDGMLQFTVGSSGKGPGSLEATPRSRDAAVSLLDYGHLRVDVQPGGAVAYRFVDETGRVLDEHVA
jgi:predicted phosphodiesterase